MTNNIENNYPNRQELPIYNTLPIEFNLEETRKKQSEEAKKIQDEINQSKLPEQGTSLRSFSRVNNYMKI